MTDTPQAVSMKDARLLETEMKLVAEAGSQNGVGARCARKQRRQDV